jgi:hypothetical protein
MTIIHTTAYQTSNHASRHSIGQKLIAKAISILTRTMAQPAQVTKSDANTGNTKACLEGDRLESEHSEASISSTQLNQLKENSEADNTTSATLAPKTVETTKNTKDQLKEQHITINAGERGISYRKLFGDYLEGAKHIEITDPYIRNFYQARNMMEFLELVMQLKAPAEEVFVHLTTVEDYDLIKANKLKNYLDKIESEMLTVGIKFSYTFENSSKLHARHITTDMGWKISLDRGLDIFQPHNITDAFQLMHRHQEVRPTKAFEVTYIKV